jgi:diguanylate cyclase (GGDEF)-like protein/PAS domain S-box-containing protein
MPRVLTLGYIGIKRSINSKALKNVRRGLLEQELAVSRVTVDVDLAVVSISQRKMEFSGDIHEGMQMRQLTSETQTLPIEPLKQQLLQALAEQQLLEKKLYTSEAQMRAVLEAMTDIILILDAKGEQVEVMPTRAALSDKLDQNLIGLTISQFVALSDVDRTETFFSQIRQALETRQTVIFEYSLTIKREKSDNYIPTYPEGIEIDPIHEVWFSANISPISEDSVIWVARNITDRKCMEKALFQEKELAQITLQSIGDAVITTDSLGYVKDCNPIAEKLTGWPVSEARGKPLSEIFKIVNEVTRQPVENPVAEALQEGQIVYLVDDTILIARDGTEYAIDDSAAPICDRQGQILGAVLVFHDVTKSRQLSSQLSWQASHDALTGLVNRRQFEQDLSDAIASVHREHHQHVLCYLDLDRFKVINDTCGHAAGDQLLCQVTALLQNNIRNQDILARLGGDEFALLIDQCSIYEAKLIANYLQELIRYFRFVWQGKIFSIGVSMGLVSLDDRVQDIATVLSAADIACYAAKKRGRNCICVYREDDLDLNRQQSDRNWSLQVKRALEENRFCLYSQQIVSLKPGDHREHYEVLLRLIDEQGQLILPGDFLLAAERYDLIGEIDRWVIRTFFAHYQQFHHTQPHCSRLSNRIYGINLSGTSISNDQFLSFIKKQFLNYNIAPQNICFEITETTAISNFTQATQFIQSLKQLGCHFALDDFGVGMSSLAYLKSLPVNYLKIDGSFVKNLVRDSVDRAMVECCNRIAHVMNIKTIAEFVEDHTTLEQLRELGVDYAQGYGIAQPIPLVFN